MNYILKCEACGYKGKTKDKGRAYATILAHKRGQHAFRADWIPLDRYMNHTKQGARLEQSKGGMKAQECPILPDGKSGGRG